MTSRLHVVVLPAWYPSPAAPEAGIFVQDQCRAIAGRHRVTVIAPPHTSASDDVVDSAVRVLRLPRSRANGPLLTLAQLRAANTLISRLHRENQPPDILHAHVFSCGAAASLLAIRWRLPVVLTEHYTGLVERSVIGRDARVARFAYRRADVVCAVSELLRDAIVDLEPLAKCRVVGNMVDVDAFESARRDHEKDGRRILAIGNADPGKGIVNLILAMRVVHEQHPDVSLHIIGAMPEGLEILIADLPVTLLGRLPRADVVNHMRKADVLAVPSRVETFGIASAEGLAAGLRVVATDVAPLADLIVKHGGIIVPANDARALGAGLIEAVEQRRPRDEGAGDELRRRYGREAIASQLDTIYRQVLGQPAAVPYSGHVEEVRTTHE